MTHSAAQAWTAIGAVLAGQRLRPPETASWEGSDVVAWLSEQGWTGERLRARRDAAQDSRAPWPQRLPDDLASGLEFARYGALLAQVRRLTGLDGLHPAIHRGAATIGPEEARLLAEVPPHHVVR